MELKTRSSDNVTVLELAGRFDAYEVLPVHDWLEKAADATKAIASAPAQVVVNLAGVNFIDSTGLSTLVQGMKHCRQQGGDLYLCNLQQPVRIIFELTRLDKAFSIFADEDEAVRAFTD